MWRSAPSRLRLASATLAALLAACSPRPAADPPLVFAAASLRDVLSELAERFADAGEPRPELNFAGSNVLARQLLAAPVADLYLAADERWMDRLAAAGRILPASRRDLVSNRLVVVARQDSPFQLERPADLASLPFRHLALGDPAVVPAGIYARAFLASLEAAPGRSVWDAVGDRVVPAADVRAALALVAADPEVIGVVYRTDAAVEERVRVLYEVEAGDGPEIRYSVALVAHDGAERRAGGFLAYLSAPEGQAVFARYGFVPLPSQLPGAP